MAMEALGTCAGFLDIEKDNVIGVKNKGNRAVGEHIIVIHLAVQS
jgi:hypothetical protein